MVVVNKLDGLSKVATGRDQDHQTLEHQVGETVLPLLPNVLNLVVCSGTVLSNVVVTCEEDTEDGKKNDDRILESHYAT